MYSASLVFGNFCHLHCLFVCLPTLNFAFLKVRENWEFLSAAVQASCRAVYQTEFDF